MIIILHTNYLYIVNRSTYNLTTLYSNSTLTYLNFVID